MALVAALSLTGSAVASAPSEAGEASEAAGARRHVPADPAVITEWNAIAARTIFTENATPVPSSSLYFGFVSLATYDAVVTIEGRYEPYATLRRARPHASSEVAAATAAYRVLRHYFPASAANLAADYRAYLAGVPRGAGLVHGTRVGEAAAAKIIRLRRDDGRDVPRPLDVAPAPGVWRPTPDAFAPMAVSWLGFVRPLVLDSPTQFPLPGPDDLGSEAYARDFAEVAAYGAGVGSSRTEAQTETALFWSDNAVRQYQEAMRDQVTRRGLDIVESARAFALLNTSTADAMISCWRAKYDEAYWRPITAIRAADTDGNDATAPQADWAPLVQTPPYPDYVSGHACYTGAVSSTLGHLFGPGDIDLGVSSAVTGTTRHYDTVAALDEETMNARIWLGLHFRRAMTDGNRLGHDVGDHAVANAFRPTG